MWPETAEYSHSPSYEVVRYPLKSRTILYNALDVIYHDTLASFHRSAGNYRYTYTCYVIRFRISSLHLSIIVLLTICLVIVNHEAFGYDANNVKIINIHTQPSTIKVGDKFTITATLTNNTPDPIFLTIDPCGEPFPIHFDNHVKVDYVTNLACPAFALVQKVNPSEAVTKTSPSTPITPSGKPSTFVSETVVFRAIASGITNATIAFSYSIQNQTDHSQIQKTISEPFLFTIYDNNTIGKSLKLGNHPVINKILSPLKQFKSGVAANDIICRPDLQLLIQNQENLPICVKLASVPNLLHRDWSYPTNCKYVHDPFTAGVAGLIVIENNASDPFSGKSYSPRNSTVVIGWNNTVSWINQDIAPSSVTSNWNLFDSGPILPENEWRHDFECAGNYGYHSEPHPWMKGWIRVLPPSR